jgi:anaerobic magnesium-protoporphyrin IX monomethyl ester cyclase
MKVLLSTLNAKYIHINLAIRQLYALNKDAYPNLSWKEFTIKEDVQTIAEQCAVYDVVAFSCYIWNITPTLLVTEAIKAINPNCKIMLGGPEVSYEWQPIIENDSIDYIIIGEGEIPFEKFLAHYPAMQNVPSIVFKTNGAVHYNSNTEGIDVERYSNIQPYIFDEPATLNGRVAYLETSRGCPYKCEFCLASLDNKVRYLPQNHIDATLYYLMQHGKVIKFLDRTFNIKKDFTIRMFQFILEHHKPGNVFQFEITADIVHPDIIKFIQEHVPAGLFRFEIGIQTVNQKANLEVSRKQNFEKTTSIIKQLQNKIELHLDLIVGLPLDEYEDIIFSFEEVFKLFAPELQLGFLKFLKGTPMRAKAAAHGYTYDAMPPYQLIKSNYLSEQQLYNITLAEHCLEIYWNKPRAVHTSKYITKHFSIFNFYYGLGKYIAAKKEFHKLILEEVYVYLYEYAKIFAPNNTTLLSLICIDYLLQYKVRPKQLFAEEVDRKVLNKFLQTQGYKHTLFRYRAVTINFDWEVFTQSLQIMPTSNNNNLIIQYNGMAKGQIVSSVCLNNDIVIA